MPATLATADGTRLPGPPRIPGPPHIPTPTAVIEGLRPSRLEAAIFLAVRAVVYTVVAVVAFGAIPAVVAMLLDQGVSIAALPL